MAAATKTETSIVARLYGEETITIGPTTGKERLADSADILPGHVYFPPQGWVSIVSVGGPNDPYLVEGQVLPWGTNAPNDPTEATEVEVWEVTEDASFQTMFGSLGEPRNLCVTQGQILRFVTEHRDKCHPWRAMLFLFKVGEELFVAFVLNKDHGLEARICLFDRDGFRSSGFRYRVVVPKLN